jgi:hypothetical protein
VNVDKILRSIELQTLDKWLSKILVTVKTSTTTIFFAELNSDIRIFVVCDNINIVG